MVTLSKINVMVSFRDSQRIRKFSSEQNSSNQSMIPASNEMSFTVCTYLDSEQIVSPYRKN